ncbi:hypothetical protein IVA80_32535 [Bradyrhizobium sp. 139]|nr:hypothetical protein [Bradyrhizobium sp. 139]
MDERPRCSAEPRLQQPFYAALDALLDVLLEVLLDVLALTPLRGAIVFSLGFAPSLHFILGE